MCESTGPTAAMEGRRFSDTRKTKAAHGPVEGRSYANAPFILFTMPPFPFSPPWFRPTAAIPSITKLAKRFETIVDVLNALPHVDVIASETFPHLVREEGNQSERRSEA